MFSAQVAESPQPIIGCHLSFIDDVCTPPQELKQTSQEPDFWKMSAPGTPSRSELPVVNGDANVDDTATWSVEEILELLKKPWSENSEKVQNENNRQYDVPLILVLVCKYTVQIFNFSSWKGYSNEASGCYQYMAAS